MPSPTALRALGHAYVVVSALLWPLTTLISTALALKLKVPPLFVLRRRVQIVD